MKKEKTARRFDAMAMFAGVGCIWVLLFESVFIFELYRLDPATIEPFLPEMIKPHLSHLFPIREERSDEPVMEQGELIILEKKRIASPNTSPENKSSNAPTPLMRTPGVKVIPVG